MQRIDIQKKFSQVGVSGKLIGTDDGDVVSMQGYFGFIYTDV